MPAYEELALDMAEQYFAGKTIGALLVNGSYEPAVGEEYVADIAAYELTYASYSRLTATGVAVAAHVPELEEGEEFVTPEIRLSCDDLTFGPLDAEVEDIGGIVFFLDTGDDATSRLLAHDIEGPFDPPAGPLTYRVDPDGGVLTITT